jgi:hypothetical protein
MVVQTDHDVLRFSLFVFVFPVRVFLYPLGLPGGMREALRMNPGGF